MLSAWTLNYIWLVALLWFNGCSNADSTRAFKTSKNTQPTDRAAAVDQKDELGCTLTAIENNIIFGKTTSLSFTTVGKPTGLTIDGVSVPLSNTSVRFTPKSGGANTVVAKVFREEKEANCSIIINAYAPSMPGTAKCTPNYTTFNGGAYGVWLGADVGLSYNLADNRTLTLFGDTFLGAPGKFSRIGAQMVGNTISISSCINGVYTPSYFWWDFPTAAKPFFRSSDQSFDRYWATSLPWRAGDFLYIPLNAIQKNDSQLGFQNLRTDVAIVANPGESPSAWNITYKTLFDISSYSSPTSQGTSNFWGGIYNVTFGDYIYFYNNSGNDLTMSRLPLDKLSKNLMDPTRSLEYLAKDSVWKPGYVDADAKRLGIPANTGVSVRYNFKMKKWLMIYFDTTSWISNSIFMRTADELVGPWSERTPIYQVPEVTAGTNVYNAKHMCYQAFEHLDANSDPDNEIALTYACNALDLSYVASNMNIYFPKFLRIKIPIR